MTIFLTYFFFPFPCLRFGFKIDAPNGENVKRQWAETHQHFFITIKVIVIICLKLKKNTFKLERVFK